MTLDQELSLPSIDRDATLTVGVFDGVHRGHQHLIAQVIREAKSAGRLSGVVTFSNHPQDVLVPGSDMVWLTDLEERVRLIKQTGVDFVVPITFDLDLSRLTAEQFLTRLVDRLRMKELVVGPDFGLGHGRGGSVETLPGLAQKLGFTFQSLEPLVDGDTVVKSTVIRRLVSDGVVDAAARMLGRHFFVKGTVVTGQGRGHSMGFPTANLKVADKVAVPGDGIYATWAHVGSRRCMAATSIGIRPTFDDEGRTIEAFLLDFSGDLYGQTVRLEFVKRLRGEEKFDTVEALMEQIDRDVQQTRELLRS